MVVPSGASPLLLVLLLWGVGEPPGPRWRAGLGVAVLDSRLDGSVIFLCSMLAGVVVVLEARLGGGTVILSSGLDEEVVELGSRLGGGMVILSSRLGEEVVDWGPGWVGDSLI